ncbi:MAG: PEP-CTERM sorting domain-containing protein [Edaphobacter sp.]
MLKLLSSMAILAVLAAPIALHATPITGQFSITGSSISDNGSILTIVPNTINNGATGTFTDSFLSLLTANEAGTITSPINYGSYTPGSASIVLGTGPSAVTFDITSFSEKPSNNPGFTNFIGVGTITAAGFDATVGDLFFSTQGNGTTTFSATVDAVAPTPSVPEPSTLALLGTGLLALAGLAKRHMA